MIRIVARRELEFEGAEAALADAMESILAGIEAMSRVQGSCPPGKDLVIELVLGGREQAGRYGVREDALGFFAVCSDLKFDADDEDEEDGWYEVPEGFECHVNVGQNLAAIARDWHYGDETARAAYIEASLVTVAHEIGHALEWIVETGGLTPLEVYDQGGAGEVSLLRTLKAIDASRGRQGAEDEVEEEARVWVAAVFPFRESGEWVDKLDAALAEPALRP